MNDKADTICPHKDCQLRVPFLPVLEQLASAISNDSHKITELCDVNGNNEWHFFSAPAEFFCRGFVGVTYRWNLVGSSADYPGLFSGLPR